MTQVENAHVCVLIWIPLNRLGYTLIGEIMWCC